MITELLQQPGSFEINLREGTPLAIRESVPYTTSGGLPFGHICVTPQRIAPQTLTRTAVLSAARWTGRIGARSNRMHTFTGNGLPVWLGDADDKSDTVITVGIGTPAVFANCVIYILTTVANGNGIVVGDLSGDTGNTISTIFNLQTPIDVFNQFGDATGNAWRVNPDGTFDIGGSLFRTTPSVILLRGEGGTDHIYAGLNCPDLDVDEDFDDYATYCFVHGESSATGSNTMVGTIPKGFDGSAAATIVADITSSDTTTARCNATAASYLAFHNPTRRQVTATVEVDDPRHYMEPGDQVYLYDPESGLVDTANQVFYLGRVLQPAKAQLRGITWPVTSGMGVYSIQTQDASNAVVDLSDWFLPETGAARLELGAPARPAALPAARPFGTRTA